MRMSRFATTKTTMFDLAQRGIPGFRERFGRHPFTLGELAAWPGFEGGDRVFIADAWGRPYAYGTTGPVDVRLLSLGRDGQPGGAGEDADIRYPEDFTEVLARLARHRAARSRR